MLTPETLCCCHRLVPVLTCLTATNTGARHIATQSRHGSPKVKAIDAAGARGRNGQGSDVLFTSCLQVSYIEFYASPPLPLLTCVATMEAQGGKPHGVPNREVYYERNRSHYSTGNEL